MKASDSGSLWLFGTDSSGATDADIQAFVFLLLREQLGKEPEGLVLEIYRGADAYRQLLERFMMLQARLDELRLLNRNVRSVDSAMSHEEVTRYSTLLCSGQGEILHKSVLLRYLRQLGGTAPGSLSKEEVVKRATSIANVRNLTASAVAV